MRSSSTRFVFIALAVVVVLMMTMSSTTQGLKLKVGNIGKAVGKVVKEVEKDAGKVIKEAEKVVEKGLKALESVGASCKYSNTPGDKRFECDVGFKQKLLANKLHLNAAVWLDFNIDQLKIDVGVQVGGKTLLHKSMGVSIPPLCVDVIPEVGLCLKFEHFAADPKKDCLSGHLDLYFEALGEKLKVFDQAVGFHVDKCKA
ncbi:hypothetical protein C9374_007853 [Naegleria lovaniensis]|uniref:Uncharacterized protein n=1 Tax=Naegleria lovaniensis TaxID=51637 RepID=A0AA88GKC8_NAELO|nr:uncharacterized protein C9374_007853 [Naegleria lovaniensis]KAG2378705.1 hypothetical protein C9374_007853 [Naegleria lovaniensis]